MQSLGDFMIGKYHIVIQDKYVKYEFDVKRKYTVIRGDSATGKSYLCSAVASDTARCICDVGLSFLYSTNDDSWKLTLENVHGRIFFVDETFKYMGTTEFASVIKRSDNYFILVTRDKLSGIPFSVNEIYELESSKRYNNMSKPYTETILRPLYSNVVKTDKPSLIVTEDSKSGYQFFSNALKDVSCISANGKSNVFDTVLSRISDYSNIYAIVDGAAFGSEIDTLFSLAVSVSKCRILILAPESFEYLLLNALPSQFTVRKVYLNRTYDFCDLKHVKEICPTMETLIEPVESWEQFYTILLKDITSGTDFRYTKSRLNMKYLSIKDAVLKQLPDLKV